jgi:hypothetical protein
MRARLAPEAETSAAGYTGGRLRVLTPVPIVRVSGRLSVKTARFQPRNYRAGDIMMAVSVGV